jgi:hypothetical protein
MRIDYYCLGSGLVAGLSLMFCFDEVCPGTACYEASFPSSCRLVSLLLLYEVWYAMLLEAGWYWVLLIAACFAGLYH